jgi:hypothetical protein
MAIDNLFYRCSEGNQRIKYESEEHKSDKKNDPKNEKNKKKDDLQEDEGNYEAKTKIAAQKLKSIFSYIKDFKIVLD